MREDPRTLGKEIADVNHDALAKKIIWQRKKSDLLRCLFHQI